MALTLTGFCYEQLDLTDQASRYYDRGLSLFPTNDALLVAGASCCTAGETDRSVRGLRERGSVWLSTRVVLFLPGPLCTLERPVRRLPRHLYSSSPIACFERSASRSPWNGIGDQPEGTLLGYPAEAVESVFQAARRLAPDNERIVRNYRAFQEMSQAIGDRVEKGTYQEILDFRGHRMRLAA